MTMKCKKVERILAKTAIYLAIMRAVKMWDTISARLRFAFAASKAVRESSVKNISERGTLAEKLGSAVLDLNSTFVSIIFPRPNAARYSPISVQY